ncbi:hypothetical protein DIPPA_14759 [Diplonema papillatum]|nr:hypothetical protein DIPPA_14759 [Diplonema papillatum]
MLGYQRLLLTGVCLLWADSSHAAEASRCERGTECKDGDVCGLSKTPCQDVPADENGVHCCLEQATPVPHTSPPPPRSPSATQAPGARAPAVPKSGKFASSVLPHVLLSAGAAAALVAGVCYARAGRTPARPSPQAAAGVASLEASSLYGSSAKCPEVCLLTTYADQCATIPVGREGC